MSKKPETADAPAMTRLQLSRYEREQRQRKIVVIGAIIVGVLTVALVAAAVLQITVLEPARAVATVGGQPITVQNLQKRMRLTQSSAIANASNLRAQISQISQSGDESGAFLMQFYQQQYQQAVAQGTAESIAQQAYQQMVDDLLVRQEAAKRGIVVGSEEVQREVESSVGYYAATLTPFPTDAPEPTVVISGTAVVPPTAEPRLQPTSVSSDTFVYEFSKRVANLAPLGFTEAELRGFIEGDLLRAKLQEELGKEVRSEAPHFQFDLVRFNVLTDAVKAAEQLASKSITFDALISQTNAITLPAPIGDGRSVDWTSDTQVESQFGKEVVNLLSYKAIGAPTEVVTSTSNGGIYILLPKGRETRAIAESELSQLRRDYFDSWLETARNDANLVKKELEPFDLIPPKVRTDAEQFQQLYGSAVAQ